MPKITLDPDAWTRATPSADGMYLNRADDEYRWIKIEIIGDRVFSFVFGFSYTQEAEDVGGEWCGPIEIVQLTGSE